MKQWIDEKRLYMKALEGKIGRLQANIQSSFKDMLIMLILYEFLNPVHLR